MALDKREPRPVAVTAELDVDFAKEKMVVFDQAWRLLRDNFFDPAFNGVDWNKARASYEPFIAGARTSDEMRRISSLMIGELNASHLGIESAAGRRRQRSGRPPRAAISIASSTRRPAGCRCPAVVALGPAALGGDSARRRHRRRRWHAILARA